MRFLITLILLLFTCTPKSYIVITDNVDNYKSEGLKHFYIIHQIDTLHTQSGISYRLHVQEIPKNKNKE